MARRDQVARLREIGKVRDVQRQVAEADAARAAAGLAEARTRRDQGAERQDEDEARCAAVLARPSIDLALVQAWGATAEASRADLALLDARVRDADDLKTARSEAWRTALARARLVELLERRAVRRARRVREEALLADLVDRVAQRRPGR